ncbi:MAG TPA: ATP-binding cassette domain-containing protein [Bacteroidales bacterium]|nr:ATP-binding cassette domain-containing protein [Bacteroidales bacterium]
MSETVIEALVRLFALISDIHDENTVISRKKELVRLFLERHLNKEMVTRYMMQFEIFLEQYYSESIERGTIRERKRVALNSIKILAICEKINTELYQKQKIYVIVQLLDFISYGEDITGTESEFVDTVASAFNIPDDEYANIRQFILQDVNNVRDKSKILTINNRKEAVHPEIRHLYDSNLSGNISFLLIPTTLTYIMRYKGLEDLYLNGQVIFPNQTYIFDQGSSIRGAGIKTVYYSEISGLIAETSRKFRISLEAINISFKFTDSQYGLHNLNFHGEGGNLIGIIGGSGVGKSTTLSILNGTLKPQSGEVLINGYNIYDENDREALRGVIGYVPQDDLLIEELTVFQNIWFNARLCLNNLNESEITDAVNNILVDFDLQEIKDLKVGNPLKKVISGGQRKRINIALELLREPTILFVDEPTSGLSSVDSEVVMNLLKAQTHKGRLVVVNIHQPSSEIYKMFDRIMIIDRGGYQVFFGNPSKAITYFKTQTNHANPKEDQCIKCGNVNTDQILRIIEAKVVDEHGKMTRTRRVTPAEWAEKFVQSGAVSIRREDVKKQEIPRNNFNIPGIFKQSVIFLTRDILSKLADKQYILISLLGSPVLAFFLAYFTRSARGDIYHFSENDNIPAYLFMAVITSLFFGLMLSSEEIIKDRKILKREAFLNLSWFSYLNSKIMIMFILSAIQTLSFAIIGNAVLGIKGMTLSYWLVLFTTSCFGNILGLNISSVLNSVITVYIIIPFIIIPQLLFSGVLVKFDKLHINSKSAHEFVPVIGDVMTARWSFEALAVKQFRDNRYERNFFVHDMAESQNNYYSSFLIDELNRELYVCNLYRDSSNYRNSVLNSFERLRFHIGELSEISGISPGSWRDSISLELSGSSVEKKAAAYLATLKKYFTDRQKEARLARDTVSRSLLDRYGEEKMLEMRNNYENKQIKRIVLDADNLDKTYRLPGKIVQKADPGYMVAAARNGRAHFYAPCKRLGNLKIDTYFFNIMVIWLESIVLYFTLYTNIFRKLFTFIGSLRRDMTET